MDLKLDNKVVVVTGGSGFVGRNLVQKLVGYGCQVVSVDKTHDAQSKFFADLVSSKRLVTKDVDLGDKQRRQEFIESIMSKEFGPVDCLVNNASFVADSLNEASTQITPESKSEAMFSQFLEVNLTALFDLSVGLAPKLSASADGNIVNIGSIYSHLGPNWDLYRGLNMSNPAGYAASKGGLTSLTRWLATTLAPSVRVNAISPGGIRRNQPLEFINRYEKTTPLQRMATEGEVVDAIIFMIGYCARYITGQDLLVDGGRSIW